MSEAKNLPCIELRLRLRFGPMQTISITLPFNEAVEAMQALEKHLYDIAAAAASAKEQKDGDVARSCLRSFQTAKALRDKIDVEGKRVFFGW